LYQREISLSDKSPTKGETSRQNIIEAAYRLFLEKGYNATSIRDISRRCGLTIGGVYTHFSDKEQIFLAVFSAYHPWRQILPAMSMAQGDTIDDLLHDMARRMIAALGVQREALNLIFTEVVEFQGRHFAETLPQFFPGLVEIIEKMSQKQGSLRPIPLPVLARSFFGLFFSYFMTNIVLADRLPFDQNTLDAFVDIYLHGILFESGSPKPISAESNA
jgi:Transcriptional regulator